MHEHAEDRQHLLWHDRTLGQQAQKHLKYAHELLKQKHVGEEANTSLHYEP